MGDTKEQWKTIVSANDLDAHMLEIGQAQANAEILTKLLSKSPSSIRKVYVPGCGTGQLFELIDQDLLKNYELLFTDINQSFLDKLATRLNNKLKFRTAIDDVESSKLTGPFDSCIVVLLLEHVDMNVALEHIIKITLKNIFIIIQSQPENMASIVTTKRQLRPTIQQFSETAKPTLVAAKILDKMLNEKGFRKINAEEQQVQDNKVMLGLHYTAK